MELFRNLHELEWLPAGQPGEGGCGTNDGEDRVSESGASWDDSAVMMIWPWHCSCQYKCLDSFSVARL